MLGRRIVANALFAAIALALVGLFVHGLRSTLQAERSVCLGLDPVVMDDAAPAFDLRDLDGRRLRLADLRGKVVLLHFWATWCPPCVEELPTVARLMRNVRDPAFRLVTVSVDDDAETVRRFLKAHRLTEIPVLLDTARDVPRRYGTEKFPETYLIDREGRVRYRFVNQRNWGTRLAAECVQSALRGL